MEHLQLNYYVSEIRFGNRVLQFEQEIWTIGYVEDRSGDELFVIRSPKGDIVPSGFAEVDNSMGVGFEFDTDTFFPLGRYGHPEGSVRIRKVTIVRPLHNVWLWAFLTDEDGNNVATFRGCDKFDELSSFVEDLEEEFWADVKNAGKYGRGVRFVSEEFGDGGKGAVGEACEAERHAVRAREAARHGDTPAAHRNAAEALKSLVRSPRQAAGIRDTRAFALALGKMMEEDVFSGRDMVTKAVAITYYYLTKAIRECAGSDPYLYVYRVSVAFEYNRVFYHLFAHSEGKEFEPSFDIGSCLLERRYESQLRAMQMCDMFTEPRVGRLDSALDNIFHQYLSGGVGVDPEEAKRKGGEFHDRLYSYLKAKVESFDFDF